jgi:hypothetical protein
MPQDDGSSGSCETGGPGSDCAGRGWWGVRPIDTKFAVMGDEIIKTTNGEVLPLEEPLFLMRARDWLAIPALRKYRELAVADGCNDYLLEGIDENIRKFTEFQTKYPERMKQPGITRGQ